MKFELVLAIAVIFGFARPAVAEIDVYCDNVVVVLDASGSMNEPFGGQYPSKMDAAKAALNQVLKRVPASTHIGVLVFSATNFREDWLFPLGPRDDARLSTEIDRLQAGFGTPLGRYMKLGEEALRRQRQRQLGYGTYRLLIVTDGEADDQDLVDRYTPEIIAQNICIDVIGVKMRMDHPLATKVHSYRRADDSQALSRAIVEVFAEISAQGTDAVSRDDFAVLAALPDYMALPMLNALNSSVGAPINDAQMYAPRQIVRASLTAVNSPIRMPGSYASDGRFITAVYALIILCIVALALRQANTEAWR